MARYYRRAQNYGRKNKNFFRNRGRYWGYSRGYSQAPRDYQSAPQADVNVVVGRKRIWIFNNTDDVVAILPGQYIVLEITREGDNQLGHFFRTAVLGDGKTGAQDKAPEAPEERPQDWV
jgi:hypothetical protein